MKYMIISDKLISLFQDKINQMKKINGITPLTFFITPEFIATSQTPK